MRIFSEKPILKLIFLLPIFAVVFLVNYVVDPVNLFRTKSSAQNVVRIMMEGKNVLNADKSSFRLITKYLIERMGEPKDVLLFGSSRGMNIHARNFPGKMFFNASVNAATIEDGVAVGNLLFRNGKLPAVFVYELDPWLLNAHNGRDDWRLWKSDYAAGLDWIGVADWIVLSRLWSLKVPEKWAAVFSPKYFQDALKGARLLLYGGASASIIVPTNLNEAAAAIKFPDGSMMFPGEMRGRSVAHVSQLAKRFTNAKPMDYFEDFHSIDPALEKILSRLVRQLKREGTTVVFLLTPLHPVVYDHLSFSGDAPILPKVMDTYRKISKMEGISLIGSYDPAVYACGDDEFYDGIHPKESCIEKIFLVKGETIE